MRGKNIVWLSLIAMLFSAIMIGVATAQCECRIYVDPAEIHNEDLHIGTWNYTCVPPRWILGSGEFTVDINVECIEDLYAYAFTLDYASYGYTLVAFQVTDCGFLDGEGIETHFVYDIDHFRGDVKVGNTRLGNVPGVSGDGTLVSITFKLMDAGSSDLNLIDVELYDSNGELITCAVEDSYYFGPELEFRDISFDPGRAVNVRNSDSVCITTAFENIGDVPLMARLRYDVVGEDAWHTFYCGQTYRTEAPPPEYLYVNEFEEWWKMWPTYGTEPWLDAPDDGNYVETGPDGTILGVFGFEDIDLGTRLINNVVLEGYTNGPYDEGADYDVYTGNFDWVGSLYGKGAPAWVTPRWTDGASVSDIDPSTKTQAGLNSLQLLLLSYYAGPGNFIDCLRLRVEFASVAPVEPPEYELGPHETMECTACWILTTDDIGHYNGKATVQFTYGGTDKNCDPEALQWINAELTKPFHLKIFWPGKAPPK